ncbi:FAD/NAD(P)-binding protein [Arthrobacter sp. LAPM80]|uniref:FAD/NAD(P)-binding protein n=1 Tax=Arthrobacter sp. LAPM80 TaxID=3141788 RepID=UPI00398AAF08
MGSQHVECRTRTRPKTWRQCQRVLEPLIRIAAIGGGPKCLFALLALHDLIPSVAAPRVTVDVYDPLPPGAGSVWRVSQPNVLRLNVNRGIVDASSSLSHEDFTRWIDRIDPAMSGEKYPPRALVGRYLSEQFQLLCQRGNIDVNHVPVVVNGVEREASRWRVSGPSRSQLYDEVLLATGHGLADALPADPLAGALNINPLIGDYAALSTAEVPPESSVWIRGAALTAYDVALLLTEGRGGSWEPAGEDSVGIRYSASGKEPRRITLSSRSGTLMDPKPQAVPEEVTACLAVHRQRLRQWGVEVRDAMPDGGRRLARMWLVLLNCAVDCASVMGAQISALELWRTALTGESVSAGPGVTQSPLAVNAVVHLRNSLSVNELKAPLTTGWIWARVWSGLYAELVVAMDRLPRNMSESRQFTRVARNLERFAFGPPELTARKLVALFDAGILHVATPGGHPSVGAVLVDAVTPGPGVLLEAAPQGCPNSDLVGRLLKAGEVSVRPGDRGLLTEPDGTCLARDGSRNESLVALGRPTEDPTLGHDTLNRSLHGEHRLWAQRVASRTIDQINT